jgi:Uma2 family endonuclease
MAVFPAPTLLESEQPQRISFADYLRAYDSYEGGQTEWLAGEVAIYPMTNNVPHQQLLQFLNSLLDYFLAEHDLGVLLLAGVPMYVGDAHPAREPDLLVVLKQHQTRIAETYLDGIADVVVEIVSPESMARDRAEKLREYEALGIPEYWLFDPIRTDVVFYGLGDDGHYHPIPCDKSGRLVSRVLAGFRLHPSLLWKKPYPRGREVGKLVAAMAEQRGGDET